MTATQNKPTLRLNKARTTNLRLFRDVGQEVILKVGGIEITIEIENTNFKHKRVELKIKAPETVKIDRAERIHGV